MELEYMELTVENTLENESEVILFGSHGNRMKPNFGNDAQIKIEQNDSYTRLLAASECRLKIVSLQFKGNEDSLHVVSKLKGLSYYHFKQPEIFKVHVNEPNLFNKTPLDGGSEIRFFLAGKGVVHLAIGIEYNKR